LKSLTNIYLADNKLTSLPASIGQLKKLKRIDILGSPVKFLPEEIAQLKTLEYFLLNKFYLTNQSGPAWETANMTGFKIPIVPDSIAGHPVSHFLQRNDIDKWSKLYVTGKLSLTSDTILAVISDRIFHHNRSNQDFYMHLLFSFCEKEEDDSQILMNTEYLFEMIYFFDKYIIERPCEFLSLIKQGPYKEWYADWVEMVYSIGSPDTADQLRTDMIQRLKNNCGTKYLGDLEELMDELMVYEEK
jgi:Leucine-rich repeat (LRR) protein